MKTPSQKEDMKYLIIDGLVNEDLTAISKGNYKNITLKMSLISPKRLETIIQLLNLGLVDSLEKDSNLPLNANPLHSVIPYQQSNLPKPLQGKGQA